MSNYIIISLVVGSTEIDLLIPDTIQNTFTVCPLDKVNYRRDYSNFREVLSDLRNRPDRFTVIPTNASTVDEVITLHPELFI